MAKGKYKHLIKPLSIAAYTPQMMRDGADSFRNTGNVDSVYWLNGREHLEGLPLNFAYGFCTGLGDWHPGMDPHVHPYSEALVWVGLDPDNIEYLGSKTRYCLGKELEVHVFDKPTVVIVPSGMPHCPQTTIDVTSPIGYAFMIFALGADPSQTWMGDGMTDKQIEQMRQARAEGGRGPTMEFAFSKRKIKVSPETLTYSHKYDHLVKPLKLVSTSGVTKVGPGNTDNLVWMTGTDLEGLELSFTWGIYKSPGVWHHGPGDSDGAHVHPTDEVLVFVGTDPSDIDYLGAEISIDMGKEHERYVFDRPTAVICPGGVPHNPVIARYVDRPYASFAIGLSSEYNTTYVD